MAQPRSSIGIDLGTTNSALAFVPLQGDAGSEVFESPRWDSFSAWPSPEPCPRSSIFRRTS